MGLPRCPSGQTVGGPRPGRESLPSDGRQAILAGGGPDTGNPQNERRPAAAALAGGGHHAEARLLGYGRGRRRGARGRAGDRRPAAPGAAPGDLSGTRYPDPRVEALDKRFRFKVGNAAIERIATGFRWAEGPVYFRDGGYLLWSDIPNNRIMRWLEEDGHVSVFRTPSNYSNGNTRDREGRLITCEHDARRVTRTEPDGTITVLIDSFEGKKLNAPNDVVVASDGAVWFTDPGYGIFGNYEGHKAELELPPNVYRLDPGPGGRRWSPTASTSRTASRSRPTRSGSTSSTAGSRMAGLEYARLRRERRQADATTRCSPRTSRPASPTGCGSTRRATSGAAWAGPTRGGRGPLLRAERRPDRQDPPAGDVRQPVLRRQEAEPAVHGGEHLGLRRLRRRPGRAEAVNGNFLFREVEPNSKRPGIC